ncbi:MAG: hypothetical protein LRY50_13945 [Geovibrio sp.]|jgi:hypothetical protein|nr:hypothetical protein [Geovibrio sp.]
MSEEITQTISYWVQKKEEIIKRAGFPVDDGEIVKAVLELLGDGYQVDELTLELVSIYTQA